MQKDMAIETAVTHRLVLILPFIAIFVSLVHGFTRTLSSQINPGCDQSFCNTTNFTVVHIKAEGENDTLHYVWDLSRKPSLLLAHTTPDAVLNISWGQLMDKKTHAISLSNVTYSFGIVINKIWEYNDINDTACLNLMNNSRYYVKELDTSNFAWERIQYKNDSHEVLVTIQSKFYHDNMTEKNGTLKIEVTGFGYMDHSEALPRLLHTANSTQVDIVIDGLSTDSSFNNSRFAVEIGIVSTDKPGSRIKANERESLDDEQAPGVFMLVDLETPSSMDNSAGGYLQWRPVAYISKYRGISNSTDTNICNVTNMKNPSVHLNNSLLLSSFYDLVNPHLLLQSAAISLGTKEDGFYKKTKYATWTFTMGYGRPPDEEFSMLVILVISIGLGLPAILIVISGIVMAFRRISHKKDDLFLNR